MFPAKDLDQVSPSDQMALIVSAVIVLGAIALAGRLYQSRWAALWGAVIAAIAANSYSVAADWFEVGWGGLVGHDVWFGDPAYWEVAIYRALLVAVIFGVVVVVTWGIGRRPRPTSWLTTG